MWKNICFHKHSYTSANLFISHLSNQTLRIYIKRSAKKFSNCRKDESHNKFSKTNFHFLIFICWVFGFLLLLFVTIKYFSIPKKKLSFFNNKMKYIITELKFGLYTIKLCKSKFSLTLFPIYWTFLTLTSSTPLIALLQIL